MLITKKRPVLLQVYYFMPDHPSLLQEFTWGYEDIIPELINTHKFLNHWHRNVEAIISEALISIADAHYKTWCPVNEYIKLN
jgi:uncharacterized protein Usg